MKNMTRAQRRRQAKIRKMLLSLSLVLVIGMAAVGGTIAWLTATSGPVVNTFTIGDINITLAETTGTEYKMVPGGRITKDPTATVLANSEACYLFVKVEKSANFDTYMTYNMAEGWIKLDNVDNVWYREVSASTADQPFAVLKGNTINVLGDVIEATLEQAETNKPTLTFNAYAIQKDNTGDANEAWTKLQSSL